MGATMLALMGFCVDKKGNEINSASWELNHPFLLSVSLFQIWKDRNNGVL